MIRLPIFGFLFLMSLTIEASENRVRLEMTLKRDGQTVSRPTVITPFGSLATVVEQESPYRPGYIFEVAPLKKIENRQEVIQVNLKIFEIIHGKKTELASPTILTLDRRQTTLSIDSVDLGTLDLELTPSSE